MLHAIYGEHWMLVALTVSLAEPLSERFADAAVQTTRDEQRAGLDVRGANDHAEQHDGENRPRSGGSERIPRDTANEERRAAKLGEGAGGRAHTGTYETSALVVRMTRTRCDAGSLAMTRSRANSIPRHGRAMDRRGGCLYGALGVSCLSA
jgi:hypothetical protein